ncbi:MAG: aminotransferase class III-fold pyridoxal phosphate-dependent enzyme [Spirochaetaceae bacterium]|nr:aminotransferase class III-fold pyridoxal phosphate-dependent enzyme [Spirochaetaceae bacterium]
MQIKDAIVTDHPFPNAFSPEMLLLEHGSGCRVTDAAGKSYLDLGAGIAVNALGYGREDLADVAAAQMRKLVHVSNLYTTGPALELAGKLTGDRFAAVQYMNSGAEANESALKFARMYAHRGEKNAERHKILAFTGGFHGRTYGALACTATPKYQEPFRPMLPGVEVAPYNDVDALRKTLDGTFAGVIVEVVQGEGGLASMTPEFAAALGACRDEHDLILIADEVQTGLGRTGHLFASDSAGLKPDIVTLAKPLAGGLPLSAVLLPAAVNDRLHFGEHGTTFGGGPVTCALASHVFDILTDPAFLAAVRERGEQLRHGLESLREAHGLGPVVGAGLLRGVHVPGKAGEQPRIQALSTALRTAGVLVLRSGDDVMRIAPPLVISADEIDEGLRCMDTALAGL